MDHYLHFPILIHGVVLTLKDDFAFAKYFANVFSKVHSAIHSLYSTQNFNIISLCPQKDFESAFVLYFPSICQHKDIMKSTGFWRWCVIICNSVFLDIVHRLYFNKITTFRKLDLLPSSSKKGEERKPNQKTRPRPYLRPAQPGGPTARVSLLPLFTWRRKKIQLSKRSSFIKI
jgi:hypothetical protein